MSQEEANYRPRRAAAPAEDEGQDWSSSVEPGAADTSARGSRYADDAPDSVDKGNGEPSARGRRAFDDAPTESEDVAETQHSPRRGLGFSEADSADGGTESAAPVGKRGARAADSEAKPAKPEAKPAKQSLTEKVAAKASVLTDKLHRDKSDGKSDKPGDRDTSAKSAGSTTAKDSPGTSRSGATAAATSKPSGTKESVPTGSETKGSEVKGSNTKDSAAKASGAKPSEVKASAGTQATGSAAAKQPTAGQSSPGQTEGKAAAVGATAAGTSAAAAAPQQRQRKAEKSSEVAAASKAATGSTATGSDASSAARTQPAARQGQASSAGGDKGLGARPDATAPSNSAPAKQPTSTQATGKGSTANVVGTAAAGTAAGAAAHAATPKAEKTTGGQPGQPGQVKAGTEAAATPAASSQAPDGAAETTGAEATTPVEDQTPKSSPWARPDGDTPSHHRSSRRGRQGGQAAPVQPYTQRPDPSSDGPSTGSQPAIGGADGPHRPDGPDGHHADGVGTAAYSSAASDEPKQKHRLAWLVSAVALVAVIALVSWAAVTLRGDNVANAPTGQPQNEPAPVLTQDSMLNDTMAKDIDSGRTWNQSLSSDGIKPDSPSPACINPTPDGQPMPNISLLRGNEATPDNDKQAVLHRADAYNSPEEAAQIFNVRSSDLGGCTGSSFYVEKGYQVEGLGDQALAVRLVLQDKVNQYHTVLLVRTGTVVNIYDVAKNSSPVDPEPVVKAASASINRQCGSTGGLCASPNTSVKAGIPPVGGDEPGFLAAGDIPRITQGSGSWNGTATNSRINIQDGTGCEAVDFNTVDGPTSRQHRTYVLRNDPNTPGTMGVDEVVLTMGNAGQASDLVSKVSNSISGCATRTLTGEASKANPLTTPGEGGTQIKGNWFTVTQKVEEGKTAKYRVGVFSAGQKFVYIRSNAFEKFDFVDEAWVALNLRAGERLTQSR